MVITSPFSNIKSFVTTRPPLVLFTLCLIAFAITTFTFAYYVEHKNDLPNIDAHKDWVSFLKYLSERKLCITPSDPPVVSPNYANENETGDNISILVQASIKSSLNINVSNVQGRIYTLDWVSQCPLTVPVNDVKISFKFPQHANNSYFGDTDICVAITGPKELLSPAANVNQCNKPTVTSHATWARITNVKSDFAESKHNCTDGVVTSITFIPSPYNNMLLSLHDRSIINLHLFHTSYFMLVMAITLICYAMIRGKPNIKHQQFEKIMIET